MKYNDEATWLAYYKKVREYERNERSTRPLRPLQYGPHIDSLPREIRAEIIPISRSVMDTSGERQ
jgi:hypothetical protein